ncbi:hypothetical protein WICPIJ_007498 [Wickerhamomyces pijperi]|uniref:Uncharacterized protein n=1 Tax=Wickerhamomyces pijperi TaxID=599730 RepID=A0A9P8Q0C3_WICPI|nr:hypothetical protein WICPIJ_007498 [Wickerhamomyces pijperi]
MIGSSDFSMIVINNCKFSSQGPNLAKIECSPCNNSFSLMFVMISEKSSSEVPPIISNSLSPVTSLDLAFFDSASIFFFLKIPSKYSK